ncbi:Xaa-Pro peptidase family protein [Kamptonema cortianum]|nr:Xaa-Pro peptidase family protein [Geitlerinema splendidum]MDK3157566.1 Xaa-Pro peptidase family protein [Kamptonema cortianum]
MSVSSASPSRIRQFATVLQKQGVSAFFAHHPVTMKYLTGFHEGAGERFLVFAFNSDGRNRLICPALTVNQASRAGVEDIRGIADGEAFAPHVQALVKDFGISGQVAVDDEMPAAQLLSLQKLLPAIQFVNGSSLVAQLARKKDENELGHLYEAGRIADAAFKNILSKMKVGMTESQIDRQLQEEMALEGGKPNFCILAAGANGAEPHHGTDDTVVREGDVVLMDFGCTVDGYFSDITRTVAFGSATEEQKKVYRIVYDAHMAAREAIRPGVLSGTVDAAARQVIEKAGYGEFFVHRTGHGLGLKIHEEPYIMPGGEVALEEGDCFSIEPGIYLPQRFGVRLENIVHVTADGHGSFNDDPEAELRII